MWLLLTGAALAVSLQMHYLSLILIPMAGILWLHEILYRKYQKKSSKNLIKGTLLSVLIFLIIMSPLFWFDLRHDFLNYKAITHFFASTNTVTGNIWENFLKIPGLFTYNLVGRYMAGQNIYLQLIVSSLILFVLINGFYKRVRQKVLDWPIMALGIWLIIGLIGVSFYQQEVYDHYLGFLNPAPFLLLGSIASINFGRWERLVNGGILILVITLAFVNLQKNPQLTTPQNQLKRTQEVAKYIIQKAQGKDFNFALIAKNNYDAAYNFYLDLYGYKPKQLPFVNTGQLLVVCEDPICDPTHNAKYEVAAFGMSKIDWSEEFEGVKIYRLIPNPSGKP